LLKSEQDDLHSLAALTTHWIVGRGGKEKNSQRPTRQSSANLDSVGTFQRC